MKFRIGQGFDAHKLVSGRLLILGGIAIPFELGLEGHSDADVLTHAIIDSLIGALSLGNIGTWFPDNDIKYKNANSTELLKTVISHKSFKEWQIVNIDSTIITEKPKLSPFIPNIQKNLANTLNTEIANISIKPKTTEKMGFCGRGEGIAVFVNTLLYRNPIT